MVALSDQDRARIRDTIAAAEAKTAGEIFVVVAGASDEYSTVSTGVARFPARLASTDQTRC